MGNSQISSEKKEDTKSAHHHQDQDSEVIMVMISVDGPVQVPFGKHKVVELKALVGVSAAFDLDVVVGGRLVPLNDNDTITIEGGEQFSAQPRCGSAS